MKVSELIKQLEPYGDFDVEVVFTKEVPGMKWPTYRKLKLNGVCDVGYSDGVVLIDGVDDER